MPIHSAPAADCVCGIYGAALATQARPFLWMPGRDQAAYRVVGRVSLWGRMVQAQRGWRAELGYPERIYVPATSGYARRGWRRRRLRAQDVAGALHAYGVPVDVTDTLPAGVGTRTLAA